MTKYRTLKNPEWKAKKSGVGEKFYYLFSVDVGRISDRTEVCIFRVNITKSGHIASLVNQITLGLTPETKPFSIQARDLKELIEKFNPREVVIDTNGLGKQKNAQVKIF